MIIDACLFFNEVELLDARMEYLSPVVDMFVVVEGAETFSGNIKPLYVPEWMHRKWHNRFIHHIPALWDGQAHDFAGASSQGAERFYREAYYRNHLATMASDLLKPGDTLVMSDVDEFPNREEVAAHAGQPGLGFAYHAKFYRYYLNAWEGGTYPCSIQATWPLSMSPQNLRNQRFSLSPILAGWHFSTLYDIGTKHNAFSHAEYDTPEWTQIAQENKRLLKDPYNRSEMTYIVEKMDQSFPDPFWDTDKYAEWIYK